MIDLKKLNEMLVSALESESTETLNMWIDKQLKEDQSQDAICATELELANNSDKTPRRNIPISKKFLIYSDNPRLSSRNIPFC